ncbi:MAG: PD-(D/E)XK nuclease family protein [Candidatus Eisenbacteria bacterium]
MTLFDDEPIDATGIEAAAGNARKPWTSPSRLSTFLQCPRKYDFQHLKKLPTRPSPHLDLGSNVHAALRDWLRLPPGKRTWDGLLEFYRAAWRTNRPAFVARSRDELREWGERGIAMLRRFVDEAPPDLLPLAIEKWVGIDFGDVVVRGKVDRVDGLPDGSLRIVDYKTGRFPKDPARTRAEDLAAAVYARGSSTDFVGAPVADVEYLYLDTMERLTFTIDDAWQAQRETAVVTLARSALAAEKSGDLPPVPGVLCAWCDFKARCPEGQAFLDARAGRG